MAMSELSKAFRLIAEYPELSHFVGPRPESLVALVEQVLNVRFPLTYRTFLRELGAGAFGSVEVYGVCDDDWEDSGIPDMVWITLGDQRAGWLPSQFVHIGDDGMGNMLVLDLREPRLAEEPKVFAWAAGRSQVDDDLEVVAPDFGTFFLSQVEAQLRRSQSMT
jgi:hypothetical protein